LKDWLNNPFAVILIALLASWVLVHNKTVSMYADMIFTTVRDGVKMAQQL